MYNNCIIYDAPTHQGTLKSSVDIDSILNSLGLLWNYGVKYNRKEHLKNLISAKRKLAETESTTPELEYARDVVNEIFTNLL
jgi:hypothetical protein